MRQPESPSDIDRCRARSVDIPLEKNWSIEMATLELTRRPVLLTIIYLSSAYVSSQLDYPSVNTIHLSKGFQD